MLLCRVSILTIVIVTSFISNVDLKGSGYIFNNEFARVTDGNTSWLKLTYFTFGQYNRTAKAANFELELFMDVTKENDAMVHFSFFILKNNEYKKTPISFPKKVCDILGTKYFDLPNITKNSTFKDCPLLKGPQYAYDIMLTSNGWPKFLPEGRFLLELDFVYKNEHIIKVEWFLEIIAV
ncbi:uncharacterized protein LOC126884731 [Diabrotica virgifera virgifera]|uniref:MD-2-related lipid-recognition domain-containing protein n=1 Tax=Diabrotica virgifera virgifera TaxID=50390 RepID=A0ABM5K9F1_DIAVI|nr:uncharacterized protein LOC126884731 [Diabrotica virgifera virgifera]